MQSVPTTEGDEPHGPASDTEDAPATRAPIRKRSLPAWLKSPTPTKVYIEAIEVAFAEPSTPWEEARVPRLRTVLQDLHVAPRRNFYIHHNLHTAQSAIHAGV